MGRRTGQVTETATCQSCDAAIVWATTERDRRMPVDAQTNLTGNLILCYEVDQQDRPVSGQLVMVVPDGYSGPRWISHFATCKHASLWRKRAALRGEL